MEGHLEALLEMDFCTKPPNFGVEAHMEAPTGDALITRTSLCIFLFFSVTPPLEKCKFCFFPRA
jgi:hypothetical protein